MAERAKKTAVNNEPQSTIKDVPLEKMRVSVNAQRDLRQSRVDKLLADFSLELLGFPVVNEREGFFYIIDGQHRIKALVVWLGDKWESQNLTCQVYSGLTEQEEARMHDRLNDQLPQSPFDRFKVRVTAGNPTETSVKKIVERVGLHISRSKNEGSVSAVSALVKVYERANYKVLERTLKIVYGAFGNPGLSNQVIDGVARVCERYDGALDDERAKSVLQDMRGGIGALVSRADLLRKQTGASVPECIAAAAVDRINAQRGGKKLPSWWKES